MCTRHLASLCSSALAIHCVFSVFRLFGFLICFFVVVVVVVSDLQLTMSKYVPVLCFSVYGTYVSESGVHSTSPVHVPLRWHSTVFLVSLFRLVFLLYLFLCCCGLWWWSVVVVLL